ncbi:rhodanese-like domain-containing protein [Prosthecochloris sp. SCSIO W1101]|uniref:rhodanese-like domain-containing protein n=1 Tax=Prosthecochloris sp. SCSIO W1101 TaxID=2992242 RepID=UPI00223E1FD8|nr:rhodanese-like domain-containing protein [Prosthecochloris sp. SCSIO W1101]UZJ41816.1 rhodanese-like domain-containing protein [Prosthecochloris sp. SCSIO W1101]
MLGNIINMQGALDATESMIEKSYPVPLISADELSKRLKKKENILLFDTRTSGEYAKSHIDGAVLLPPETPADDFIREHGGLIREKTVVFYCSVGQRSSNYLQRVYKTCKAEGAKECYNLRGGIFRWYNQGHPVVNENGETDDIHGYNPLWGMMIEKRNTSRK